MAVSPRQSETPRGLSLGDLFRWRRRWQALRVERQCRDLEETAWPPESLLGSRSQVERLPLDLKGVCVTSVERRV